MEGMFVARGLRVNTANGALLMARRGGLSMTARGGYRGRMDIPLTLSERGDRRLVYTVPAWFRALLALCALFVLGSMAVSGRTDGLIAWIMFALSTLGALYEERWTLDPVKGELAHRYGLLPLARSLVIPFERLEGFRVTAWVAGTVPGSEEEAADNQAALGGDNPGPLVEDPRRRLREPHKRAFLQLRVADLDGVEYLLDTVPARRGASLKRIGRSLAAAAGKPFSEG